jgi:hypothetical protein
MFPVEIFRFFWDKINFELTQRIVASSRICFLANAYREVVMLLEFSIHKFKEAEF